MLRQGKTSTLEAEVWYFPGEGEDADSPYLEGPISSKAQTLKAKYFFRPTELHGQKAWKAVIPEPCLWSIQNPAIYALNGHAPLIGLRDLRVRGESFYQEDRRWVVRAARGSYRNDKELIANAITPIHRRGDLAYIDSGNIAGLPLIVWPDGYPQIEIERLSRSAAVLMLVLPSDSSLEIIAEAHSHLLLGAEISPGKPTPDWAKFAVVSEDLIHANWQPERRLPVVVTRQLDAGVLSGEEVRAHCDKFQASLKNGAEFAGLWLMWEPS
ncbi:hypothetical protein [Bremerella alba]|uniref:Uncharacterized protein n=1 Tax=Bremerella alba TaxID=980252 RepID=A0A7V8V3N7_9BACT|nr:hypothetical protein [Bremerella alba]MBA2114342.1 hypothetical protein [Bremerella alba]